MSEVSSRFIEHRFETGGYLVCDMDSVAELNAAAQLWGVLVSEALARVVEDGCCVQVEHGAECA